MNEAERKGLANGLLDVVELCNEQRWKVHEARLLLRDIRKLAKQQTKLTERLEKRYSPPMELQEAISETGASELDDDTLGELLFEKTSMQPLDPTKTVEAMFDLIDNWETEA